MTLFLTFLFLLPTTFQSDRDHLTIHSDILNEDRSIIVDLPESYSSESEKNYPIIILLDGESHLNITSEATHSSPKMEAIIVAITNVDRERDFTVTKLQTRRENTMGGGWKFLDFIETELIPEIQSKYRTSSRKLLIGHSLGGLLAINTYMDKNSPFDAFVSLDPSLWWDEDTLQQKVKGIDPSCFTKKLFIATANQGEANLSRNKLRHDRWVELTRKRMDNPGNIHILYYPDENHRSVPAASIKTGLMFVNELN